MSAAVRVFYLGRYRQITGREAEDVVVPETAKEALEYITDYFKNKYGIIPPFNLMVNGMHAIGALKKGIILKDKDEFNLIPFMSGG